MAAQSVRSLAAQILGQLLKGSGSLTGGLLPYKERDDYSLLQEMCFGSCRWYEQLDHLLKRLLDKPLRRKDLDVRGLLLVGVYQLRSLAIPDYAVINESVDAAVQLGKPWAKALVNAILRRYLRDKEILEQQLLEAPPHTQLSHPAWLWDRLQAQWPAHADELMRNNNLHPPMTLRVALDRCDRPGALDGLQQQGIQAHAGNLAPSAIYLATPQSVETLQGFREGWLSVQDEASQLVGPLLQLGPGQSVLDACAAPGGKTCAILESECSPTSLVAIDNDSKRLRRIHDNLRRLDRQATVMEGDAATPQDWWNGSLFDRILLDAPCSATGVIRRHPDIKVLRSAESIPQLHRKQVELLTALWPCLKTDGLLLYCTCSMLRDENEETIAAFLQVTQDAKYEPILADWGVECRYGRQLLTAGRDGPDGFFYALLRKTPR